MTDKYIEAVDKIEKLYEKLLESEKNRRLFAKNQWWQEIKLWMINE